MNKLVACGCLFFAAQMHSLFEVLHLKHKRDNGQNMLWMLSASCNQQLSRVSQLVDMDAYMVSAFYNFEWCLFRCCCKK